LVGKPKEGLVRWGRLREVELACRRQERLILFKRLKGLKKLKKMQITSGASTS
jgi:hypothetical protein